MQYENMAIRIERNTGDFAKIKVGRQMQEVRNRFIADDRDVFSAGKAAKRQAQCGSSGGSEKSAAVPSDAQDRAAAGAGFRLSNGHGVLPLVSSAMSFSSRKRNFTCRREYGATEIGDKGGPAHCPLDRELEDALTMRRQLARFAASSAMASETQFLKRATVIRGVQCFKCLRTTPTHIRTPKAAPGVAKQLKREAPTSHDSRNRKARDEREHGAGSHGFRTLPGLEGHTDFEQWLYWGSHGLQQSILLLMALSGSRGAQHWV